MSTEPSTQVESRVQQLPETPDHFARFFTDYLKAVPEELGWAGCSKAFLLVSTSLNEKTDRIQKLESVLSSSGKVEIVGRKVGVTAHTPYTEIIDLTKRLWESNADSIIVVGSSSYADCAKIAMIAHSSLSKDDDLTVDSIQSISASRDERGLPSLPSIIKPPTLKIFLVPTSLSAAEYHPASGATNPLTKQKHGFLHPQCRATCVVLDPELCTSTPSKLWLGSGMRAVDHCVETLCVVDVKLLELQKIDQAEINAVAKKGLELLLPGLRAYKVNPRDIHAIGIAQIGAWYAMRSILRGVPLGASHAIGHEIGSLTGVSHGETSCVMLSWVLEYNKVVNADKQESVKEIFWKLKADEEWVKLGLSKAITDAGDLVRAFVQELELPTRLSEVGVVAEDVLHKIAEYTMVNFWGKTNPRKLETKDDVMEILRMAA